MGPRLFSALPPMFNVQGYTSIYFEENQLSRNLISLSLRPTAHPDVSQDKLVRPSALFYQSFSLAMGRSSPLRVCCLRLDALFRLAFASPPDRKSLSLPQTITPGPIMQKVRRHPTKRLRPLIGNWFQFLFHSPNRGSFHLSLTVLVHYRLIYRI